MWRRRGDEDPEHWGDGVADMSAGRDRPAHSLPIAVPRRVPTGAANLRTRQTAQSFFEGLLAQYQAAQHTPGGHLVAPPAGAEDEEGVTTFLLRRQRATSAPPGRQHGSEGAPGARGEAAAVVQPGDQPPGEAGETQPRGNLPKGW